MSILGGFWNNAKQVARAYQQAISVYNFNIDDGKPHDVAITNAMHHTGLSRKTVEDVVSHHLQKGGDDEV